MKAGASDGPLYDEGRDIQWDNDFRPIELPATLNVDIDFDDYIHADDDEDEDEDEDDSYEADTSERENDSGCDIGGDSDQDGHDDHFNQDTHTQHDDLDDDDNDDVDDVDDVDDEDSDSDDASQMSAVARGKRRAVSPSSCSSANKGNQRVELSSLSFPCSSASPTSPSSPKVNKDRNSKQDCSERDPGLFPFTCPTCSKRFQKLLDLNRHCERHLPRPVQCLNCSRKLSRGDAMKRHALSVRFRACLDFGWFAERDYMLGNFTEAPSSSSSSSRAKLRPKSRSMALQEEDAFSTASSEDTYMTTSAGSSTSESPSSAEEANLSIPEQYPDDGSPVVYGEPGNWSTIRNGVRKQIEVGGPFRVRACFLEWYLPRSPRVSRPPSTSPDPPTPRPRKRASKKQKGKVDKKKRREYQE
ncbi:hypothetical protein BGZ81_004352 [Podila clonocystis]|nr:hypothetical protein BGZ81_004352 [Podila clonocystis]